MLLGMVIFDLCTLPLTCEPHYHKLLTASTELVNGVTLYELRVWMSAVKRVHMLTQINTHMHTSTAPLIH